MNSYQHSDPGRHLHVDVTPEENDSLHYNRRHSMKKRLMAVMVLGVVLVFAAVNMNDTTSTTLVEADSMPDYNNPEGQYDWKKCKESNDPDCWKKEGERVGGFWKNFGHRMKSWWKNLFGGNKEDATEEKTAEEAPKEKKKTSKKEPKVAEEPAAAKEPKVVEPAPAKEPKAVDAEPAAAAEEPKP